MIYSNADEEVLELVTDVMAENHSELDEAGVSVHVLIARAEQDDEGNPKGPGLTLRGYSVAAMIRIVGPKDRAKGVKDAEMIVNGDTWEDRSPAEQRALIDHELTHLELRTTKATKEVLLDPYGRPKLKMKLHDVEFGWFASIAERHGEASLEVQQARSICTTHGQLFFPWAVPGIEVRAEGTEVTRLARKIRGDLKDAGMTMTIKTPGKSVTIGDVGAEH